MAKKASNGEAKPRARKPRQGFLPEMEPPSIPEIDRAAERYVSLRDQRMELLKQEVDAKDSLMLQMKAHKLKTYTFDAYEVLVDTTEGLKVKRKKEAAEEDE